MTSLPTSSFSKLVLVSCALSACSTNSPSLNGPSLVVKRDADVATDLPLRNLDETWTARFTDGDAKFEEVRSAAAGLGPLFIRSSCAACHSADSKGPGTVQKFMGSTADDTFGNTVRSQKTAGATTLLKPPADAKVSLRFGPAVFGRGYIEAVLDSEIERVEAEQAAAGGSISGRINRVTFHSERNQDLRFPAYDRNTANLVGRFGVKARVATLDDFSADAYQGDMGITSPMRPTEHPNPDGLTDDEKPGLDIDLDTLNLVSDYVRLIAIPKRLEQTSQGQALFTQAQCSVCHTPSMRTRADYPIPQLANIDAPIFSDLLLHDMGDNLADGIAEESATGREWRTAPLMGIRFLMNYLHDGRAKTVADAILSHRGEGSEANDSVANFEALDLAQQQTLIDYVSAL